MPRIKQGTEWLRQLTATDLIAADTALTQNKYTEVGRVTLVAGQGLAIGWGQTVGQGNAEGRIYADLVDTAAAAVAGYIRLDLHDPNDRVIRTLREFSIPALKTSATDRTQMVPLPEVPAVATEDYALVLKVKCTAAGKTLDLSACTMLVDCTAFDAE